MRGKHFAGFPKPAARSEKMAPHCSQRMAGRPPHAGFSAAQVFSRSLASITFRNARGTSTFQQQ